MFTSGSTRGRPCGRKRQLIVDTQGRLWVASVHGAHGPDGLGAIPLITWLLWRVGERLEKVYGDQAYNGVFARALSDWSRFAGAIDLEKASRPESAQGFVPVAKRWVVERTIAWTNFFRRLVKDYEYTISSAPAARFGELALFGQHSDYVATITSQKPNLIPKHALIKIVPAKLSRSR